MSSKLERFHAVLLAGGSGTRLWPLSTRSLPKQFLSLGESGSLLQQTAARFMEKLPPDRLWVVCGENHAATAGAQLPFLPARNLLVEPMARNTLAAIGLAALRLRARDPEAVMGVFPADHYVPRGAWPKLHRDLEVAERVAEEDSALVAFGVPPTFPATGFGYLERGRSFRKGGEYFEVRAFHEKPRAEVAESYFKKGGYDWNSGMFVWRVSVFFEELHRHRPELARAFEALALQMSDPGFPGSLREVFAGLPDLSVDHGLMEKSSSVRMVPASFAWDDVGALSSLEKILPSDAAGNHTEGPAFVIEGRDNLVMARSRPVVLLGVEACIVVETEDAVLVLPRARDQDVKKIGEKLKEAGREDLL